MLEWIGISCLTAMHCMKLMRVLYRAFDELNSFYLKQKNWIGRCNVKIYIVIPVHQLLQVQFTDLFLASFQWNMSSWVSSVDGFYLAVHGIDYHMQNVDIYELALLDTPI